MSAEGRERVVTTMPVDKPRVLVWSNAQGAWLDRSGGYTLSVHAAARWSLDDAEGIVARAGRLGPYRALVPDQVMVVAPECRWQAGPLPEVVI